MPSNEEAPSEQPRTRVLILAPVGRDAALACGVLNREQLTAEVCPNVPDLISKLQAGAGTAVIAVMGAGNRDPERFQAQAKSLCVDGCPG